MNALPLLMLSLVAGAPWLTLETGTHSGAIRRIDVDAAGEKVLTASEDRTARVWRVSDGTLLTTLRPPLVEGAERALRAAALSPDGKRAVVGWKWRRTPTSAVCRHELDTVSGQLVRALCGLDGPAEDAAFSPDGRDLLQSGWARPRVEYGQGGRARRRARQQLQPRLSARWPPGVDVVRWPCAPVRRQDFRPRRAGQVGRGPALRRRGLARRPAHRHRPREPGADREPPRRRPGRERRAAHRSRSVGADAVVGSLHPGRPLHRRRRLGAQARPEDLVVVFFAGHGVLDDAGEYRFLLPASDPQALGQTSLSTTALKASLSRLKSRTLVLLDTCHSGDALGSVDARRSDGVSLALASPEAGLAVIAASSGRQVSLEDPSRGHGAFTKALLEGLPGLAQYASDGRITLGMLELYVSERVRALTGGQQTPVVAKPAAVPDFVLV